MFVLYIFSILVSWGFINRYGYRTLRETAAMTKPNTNKMAHLVTKEVPQPWKLMIRNHEETGQLDCFVAIVVLPSGLKITKLLWVDGESTKQAYLLIPG